MINCHVTTWQRLSGPRAGRLGQGRNGDNYWFSRSQASPINIPATPCLSPWVRGRQTLTWDVSCSFFLWPLNGLHRWLGWEWLKNENKSPKSFTASGLSNLLRFRVWAGSELQEWVVASTQAQVGLDLFLSLGKESQSRFQWLRENLGNSRWNRLFCSLESHSKLLSEQIDRTKFCLWKRKSAY